MKDFFRGVMKLKTGTCFLYTGTMVIYLFFCLVFDNREVSTTLLWTLLLASVAGTLIQAVCFTDWLIKKMRYTLRSLLFVVLFFPMLSVLAWKADWFPAQEVGAWVTFTASFFAIFLVMTIGFDVYFRLTGRKYDGLLGQYRREREEKKEDR